VLLLYGLQEQFEKVHEAVTIAAAKRHGATLASHDDTTADQVATSQGYGVRLPEFPTTVEAAQACHAHGIATILGAPNLTRGGSHSANVAADELARMDRLDIVSSDYVPAVLLMAVVQLGDLSGDVDRYTCSRPQCRVDGPRYDRNWCLGRSDPFFANTGYSDPEINLVRRTPSILAMFVTF
jgi:alpha-D-ribose 1-methylphosphonate 5-triphosphate diphosphatase PhnM